MIQHELANNKCLVMGVPSSKNINLIYFFYVYSIPKEDAEEPHSTSPDNDNDSTADIQDPEDYREIFQSKPRLGMSVVIACHCHLSLLEKTGFWHRRKQRCRSAVQ